MMNNQFYADRAKENVRRAVAALVEARNWMTLGALETFIRDEYPPDGNGGFVSSVCAAMVRGATSARDLNTELDAAVAAGRGAMMKVRYGNGTTEFGPGVVIELTSDEVATAIDAYLVAHRKYVNGPRTITIDGVLCQPAEIYVDPSGFVISDGERFDGRGPSNEESRNERLSSAAIR